MEKTTERFWRGPIETKSHAEKICRYTANGFLFCSIFYTVGTVLNSHATLSLSEILTSLMIGIPALLLRQLNSLNAARMLTVLSIFSLGASFLLVAFGLYKGEWETMVMGLPLITIWSPILIATIRACVAAKRLVALRR